MDIHAEGTMNNESWDEERYAELANGGGLSRASVTQTLEGGIEGEGSIVWLMCYRPDKTAEFVGLQRINGRIDGHAGSFVLQSTGTYGDGEARGSLAVVAGSGTGELEGISGGGEFRAQHGPQASFSLDLRIE